MEIICHVSNVFWIRKDLVGTPSVTFSDKRGFCSHSFSKVFGSDGILLALLQ